MFWNAHPGHVAAIPVEGASGVDEDELVLTKRGISSRSMG